MNSHIMPQRNTEGLEERNIGDEIILWDPDSREIHLLNSTAAFVLHACNGENAPDQIADLLMQEFDIDDEDEASDDVCSCLSTLRENDLVQWKDNE